MMGNRENVMLITTVNTEHGEQIDLHWSSSADRPKMWLRIKGGESIDPRDPKGLERLPITNATLLDVRQARQLQGALNEWIGRLEQAAAEHAGAYLDDLDD